MIRLFASNKRKISIVTLTAFLFQVFYPAQTFALTGGPSQPEYESFEPAGATEMVNLATGDFVYNIPLMDVDGYPINISYHGGVTMEQEASWVGLGWSLNPGSITRGMRGFPDDFNGSGSSNDVVTDAISMRPNKTYGLGVGGGFEIVGVPINLTAGLGISYNTYKGLGLEMDWGISASVSGGYSASDMSAGVGLNGGLGLSVSNQDGADFTMTGGLGIQTGYSGSNGSASASMGMNRSNVRSSRQGLVGDIVSGGASLSKISAYGGGGVSIGSAINLIPNTAYVPSMPYSTKFSGITGEIHTGGEVYWCNFYGYMRAHKFEEVIDGNVFTRPAFGYMNLDQGQGNGGAMLDFNRDNDGVYYAECPKLPFANLTYDVFNANAQGLNELFRPYRNDLGYVFDPITTGGGTANDIGIELNYGNFFEIGFNDYGLSSTSISSAWYLNNNCLTNGVRFSGNNQLTNSSTAYRTYEPSYFKAIDELHTQDVTFDNSIRGTELASFGLVKAYGSVNSALNSYVTSPSGTVLYNGQKKNSREPRNTNLSFLNAKDASLFATDKSITNYSPNTFSYTVDGDIAKTYSLYTTYSRTTNLSGKEHHISEVSITKDDGSRYVYGIPVYNKTQKEVVFNCGSNTENSDQTVSYNNGTDNALGNTLGQDQLYSGRTLTSYAHSYLLTSLLSKDYVDLTGDGPSNDDYGDYTKFNYSKTTDDYKWRNPFAANVAVFNHGKRAYNDDNKGNYIYGEKELWFLHSIETKNYVAEFYTGSRSDAQGVNGENGGISTSTNQNKKLEKIVLYSKKDLSTPIKTVNFAYNYSLCPGTPNSTATGGGKLTLEKIYFTYGKSDKGVFSPYLFTYSTKNPSYNRTQMDRWGNYQLPTSPMDNRDFPYSQQDSTIANSNARAWSLQSITTPAKSKIDIVIEADDYSYVHNQVPAQMLSLIGFHDSEPDPNNNPTSTYTNGDLYSNNSSYTPNNYMIVDLTKMQGGGLLIDNALSFGDANTIFKNQMLPASGKLYFKGFVQLGNGSETQDYVPGYSEFNASGSGLFIYGSATVGTKKLYKYAYIKLNDVDIEDTKNYKGDACNPISKAAWQITRSEYPRIAYPGSEPGGSGLTAIMGLLGSMSEVFTFKQKNGRLRKKLYSRNIVPLKSFVRLNLPSQSKFGGGHRVKKIYITDNWDQMVASEQKSVYGQTYDYTVPKNKDLISSGVASYEPLFGGDEISLRNPIEYSVQRIEAPNDAHFFESPVGEAFFPPPTVIYSKVTVRNIDVPNVKNIGRTEYEFYTTKDFPIYSAYDDLQSYVYVPKPSLSMIFNSSIESSAHLSQGSILKLNNMHGKIKSILTYAENGNTPISGVRYYYKKDSNGNLSNQVPVIDESGTISSATLGQHIEAVADFRQQQTITNGTSIMGNLNVSFINVPWPLPIPIPSVFWGSSTETRDFYSATLNKVVTQNGILDKVETISNYGTTVTENLVWDGKTSDVILNRTSTNFRDYDYNYHTPAHWVYSGMRGAYKNIGYGFKNFVTTGTGQIIASSVTNDLIRPGDEVQLIFTNASDNAIGTYSDRLWISSNGANLILINRDGKLCTTAPGPNNIDVFTAGGGVNTVLKVIRSGYRNLIDEAVESISYSSDPRLSTTLNYTANVLDASSVEYSEDWPKLCQGGDDGCGTADFSCLTSLPSIYDNTNPYIRNTRGNWNQKRNYSYMDTRLASSTSGTTTIMDIRKDGTYRTYKPFFKFGTNAWEEVYNSSRSDYSSTNPFGRWILNSEITKITPYGNVIEAKDAVNRFSSAIYAYNHTLKTASALNSRQRDIGFDSFEDYSYGLPCMENHFGFRKYKAKLAYGIAHTGRYSLKLPALGCASTVRAITEADCETNYGYNNSMAPLPTPTVTNDCSCVSAWSPVANKAQTYLLSVWIKESQLNKNGDYGDPDVEIREVSISPTPNIATKVYKSPIINGWQKIDYEFTIPPSVVNTLYTISLINNSPTNDAYFDDIRVHPKTATMGTYVYDPLSLKIWSELDDRNYATIYEYDNEGVLVRVKKETEKGIMTIKESRSSFKKL